MSIAPSAVWAQTYYPLNSPGTITFGNFNFTMGTCTYQLNNGSSTNCNNDDLEMSVTTTANSITLTYMNSLSPGSALLSQATANGCTCVQYNFTVTNTKGLSQALVKDTGYGQSGDTLDNWLETYGTSTKLAQAGITTNGYQSQSSTYYAAGGTTSMNLELGLGVNAAYQTGGLSLNSASITFVTATEPATITLLLTGIGGLVYARSRGRRDRNGPRAMGHGQALAGLS